MIVLCCISALLLRSPLRRAPPLTGELFLFSPGRARRCVSMAIALYAEHANTCVYIYIYMLYTHITYIYIYTQSTRFIAAGDQH